MFGNNFLMGAALAAQGRIQPYTELVGAEKLVSAGAYTLNTGGVKFFPRITGSNPGTRECFEGHMLCATNVTRRVTGVLIYTGASNTGKTDLKARFAICDRSGSFYTGSGDDGLPNDVINGMTMAAGLSVANARLAAGGASSRWLKYTFDSPGIIECGQPFSLRCLAECEYSVTDAATLWNTNFLYLSCATYPHLTQGGPVDAVGRNLTYNALRTGGIDTITDATMANITAYNTPLESASVTMSTKTVDVGTIHTSWFTLITQRA